MTHDTITAMAPAAFFSYVHRDDAHDRGQIRRLRDVLQGEVRMQLGEEGFEIFLDRDNIAWGQNWRRRIDDSLSEVTLLIPIITPAFLVSTECRRELELFLARERELERDDLILPIYYVSARQLDVTERRTEDPLARQLATRQYADWRELRFEPLTSPVVRQRLSDLASRMRDSFWRALPTAEARAAVTSTTEAVRAGTAVTQTAGRRTDPPTVVVDQWGRGDHTTIGAAIQAAEPGMRILVRSGLYEEGLIIDKPLEVLGHGPLQDVIVRARACDAVLFTANIGRVSNLTLQQAGGGEFYGVDIAQGRLELEDCDITSESLAVVAVRNGADPRLRRNAIHNGRESGIFVYDRGLGVIEDNAIIANATSGIAVSAGGNPTVRRNRIHDGREGGILVYERGVGSFEDNDVFANANAGIAVTSGGNPSVRRNRIYNGLQSGVFVYSGGLGTFDDNDIFANANAGIEVQTGGNPTVRRNRIHDGQTSGILVCEGGLGMFEDNEVLANAQAGIEVNSGGNPTVRRNRIHDGRNSGIFVFDRGLGVFEDNEVCGNANAGLVVGEGADPNLRRNEITGNGYQDVWDVRPPSSTSG